MSTQLVVVLVAGIVAGWVLHMIWDVVLDWLYDTTGFVGSIMYDVCAVIGVLAVCVALGTAAVHYHWFSIGT